MSTPFNASIFLQHVAARLVFEFGHAASAGTPGLIGAAREVPARRQLEKLLPNAASVGSGIVIDSYGGISKQQDIVIYEGQLCPIFQINDTPEATYYPVEGVIAAGEVKSRIGKSELEDAFEKISSVKKLRRHQIKTDDGIGLPATVSFRQYGSPSSISGAPTEEYNQAEKEFDQIFGFILCGGFAIKTETIFEYSLELWRKYPIDQCPNTIISLENGFIQPHISTNNSILFSPMRADGIILCPEGIKGFPHLVKQISSWVRNGRTVSARHFDRYLRGDENSERYTVAKSGKFT